jgi:hypothetical protein
LPEVVVGFACSIQEFDVREYSHVLYGTGLTGGASEKRPPYRKSEVKEFQRYPCATAGGPEGWGSGEIEGLEIDHDVVKSRTRKSLSVMNQLALPALYSF